MDKNFLCELRYEFNIYIICTPPRCLIFGSSKSSIRDGEASRDSRPERLLECRDLTGRERAAVKDEGLHVGAKPQGRNR